jgi:hypothetical protein
MSTIFFRRSGMPSLFRPWSVCFGVIATAIVTCMMLPGFFGLMKFTQWGGMYTDSWCRMDTYSADPKTEGVQSEWVQASTVGPGAVFSAPMHNFMSCLMWARKVQCGRVTKDGWKVTWVSPEFKGKHFFDPRNACDVPLDPNAEWFRSQLQ